MGRSLQGTSGDSFQVKPRNFLLISLTVLSAVFFLSIISGAASVPVNKLMNAVVAGPDSIAGYVFWYSRLPRTVACIAAGFALSLSGAIIQSVLANRLAAPGIIGVNSGAGFAVTLATALGAVSGWMISASAFFGAMITSLAIMVISRKTRASRTSVLLAGVALNYILGAFSDAVLNLVPQASMTSGDFRVGGFSSVSHVRLYPAVLLIAISAVIVFTLSNELEVLSLGDDEARTLGLNAGVMRVVFLLLASALAGAAVSFAGLLGFVGLLVPNGIRRLMKGDNRLLLPLSGVCGAVLVTLCDIIARMMFRPYELPVGIMLSIIGGPVFLILVLKGRRGRV